MPPRPYGHTTGSLGRSPNRPTFGTGSLGDRGPLPMREQQEGNEGQRSFEPQRPYPATPQSAPLPSQARANGEEETEEEDEQQPPTSDPRLLRRTPPVGR